MYFSNSAPQSGSWGKYTRCTFVPFQGNLLFQWNEKPDYLFYHRCRKLEHLPSQLEKINIVAASYNNCQSTANSAIEFREVRGKWAVLAILRQRAGAWYEIWRRFGQKPNFDIKQNIPHLSQFQSFSYTQYIYPCQPIHHRRRNPKWIQYFLSSFVISGCIWLWTEHILLHSDIAESKLLWQSTHYESNYINSPGNKRQLASAPPWPTWHAKKKSSSLFRAPLMPRAPLKMLSHERRRVEMKM